MTKPLTAVHHAASSLNHLIGLRRWRAAYISADTLDIILAREDGLDLSNIYTACTVTDIAEERFKRSKFN